MDIKSLIELNQLALNSASQHPVVRDLLSDIQADNGRHFVGITGPRGAGKTILLRQLLEKTPDSFYISLDTLTPDTDLFALIQTLTERYQYKTFLLDEIHFLPSGMDSLKKIFDFLDCRIVFTSSIALHMHQSAYDLARRVRLYSLSYFSFREYLQISKKIELPRLSLKDLLEQRFPPEYTRTAAYFREYLTHRILPYALENQDSIPLLANTIETIIYKDISRFLHLPIDELDKIHKIVKFIVKSAVDGINFSTLARNIGITKYKAEQYIQALEKAFVVQTVFPAGTNVIQEPKILLVPPIRLLFQEVEQSIGGLREDFVAFMLRCNEIKINYLKGTRGQKTPDFLTIIDGQKIAWEVGGKSKGRTQFKEVKVDKKIILAEDSPVEPDRLPLHLIGFLG